MPLPSTGTLGLDQVNVELFRPATNLIGLNDTEVRNLAGSPAGEVQFASLRGKSAVFQLTISTNQVDANLRSLAIAAGWNGVFPLQATINSGVWISGSTAGNSTAALTINGSFPNGVTLINNGTIAGVGGAGGKGGDATQNALTSSAVGTAGGRALLVSVPVTIQNNGTIAGGGGGGGGGSHRYTTFTFGTMDNNGYVLAPGGGGGGGRSNASYNSAGGAGGTYTGLAGSPTPTITAGAQSGAQGTSAGQGGGGAGGSANYNANTATGATGGAGGAWGTAGSTGGASTALGSAGGAAGQAISGNANITWTAFGTRLGPIL